MDRSLRTMGYDPFVKRLRGLNGWTVWLVGIETGKMMAMGKSEPQGEKLEL